jgi:NitT/TauT family transport system substrate-binding protein
MGYIRIRFTNTDNPLILVMKRLIIAFFSAGLAIALIACDKKPAPSVQREKITIAYSTSANSILMYIAFAKGYLAEEGLDAAPQPHAFGKLALNSVIEKKADLATVADTPIMFAVMNGRKITTLATIQTSNHNHAIIARRDRGIAKPADLKEKKVGVTLGTNADFFAYSFLLAHGIDKGKVKIVDMRPDEMAKALGNGRVDAVSVFNPALKLLEKDLGNKGITFFGESFFTETFCVVAEQEYVKAHPETIKKVLRALIRAETFVQQRPVEAQRIVTDFIKIDSKLLAEIWDDFRFRVALDQALLVNLEEQTRWAIKNRLTVHRVVPNYLDYIYTDGLYATKPEAVRMILPKQSR